MNDFHFSEYWYCIIHFMTFKNRTDYVIPVKRKCVKSVPENGNWPSFCGTLILF